MPKCRCGKIYDPKRGDFNFAMGGCNVFKVVVATATQCQRTGGKAN